MLKIKCFKVVLIFTFLGFSAVPYTQYVLNKPVSNSIIELDMVLYIQLVGHPITNLAFPLPIGPQFFQGVMLMAEKKNLYPV